MRIYFIFLFLILSTNVYAEEVCNKLPGEVTIDYTDVYANQALAGDRIGPEQVGFTTEVMECKNGKIGITSQKVFVGAMGKEYDYEGKANGRNDYEGRNIYLSRVPGVGFAIGASSPNCPNQKVVWVNSGSGVHSQDICSQNNGALNLFNNRILVTPRIQLYKLSNNQSHDISIRTVGFVGGTVNGEIIDPLKTVKIVLHAPILKYQCTVSTVNINVTMGETTTKSFRSSTGSNIPVTDKYPFNIILKCPQDTNLKITFDGDSSVQDKMNGIFDIRKRPGSAQGVGLQLFDGNNELPIPLGKSQKVKLNSGTQRLPYKVAYVKKGEVKPGSVNSSLTFTITYQ